MARRLRVAHLSTVHHPLDPRIYLKEARSLSKAGFDVWLLARSAGVDELEGVEFVPLPDGTSRLARLRRQWSAWTRLGKIRPDVVHIHDPELLPMAKRLKSAYGTSVIYDKHEHYGTRGGLEGYIVREVESRGLGWVDHVIIAWEQAWLKEADLDPATYRIIANSSLDAATSILNYALPAESVGPTEHDDQDDAGAGAGIDVPVLIYTGTVARNRGLFHMLDLVRYARDRGFPCRLRVVGVCNYREQRREAESYIRRYDLDGAVDLIGWSRYATAKEIQAALSRASVGLMLADRQPSYLVSIPTKFYEYMQNGLPMLVTDIRLWTNFVNRTESGHAVDPSRPELVFERLTELLEIHADEAKRAGIRVAAREFEWERMETRLLSVYEKLRV